jgi:hypothetical protein
MKKLTPKKLYPAELIKIPLWIIEEYKEAYIEGFRAGRRSIAEHAGRTKSKKKAAAVRRNGKLGGARNRNPFSKITVDTTRIIGGVL